jgi:hypothetical protein
MVNENINQVNFSSKTKEELSKMNSVSGKKSLGAKKRWFREKNPDIQALMEFYKSGNQLEVMEKYMFDNEQFMELYKNAKTNEEKRRILRDYQFFQLKIYELIFGNKNYNANLNLNKNVTTAEIVIQRLKDYKQQGYEEVMKKEIGSMELDEVIAMWKEKNKKN